MTVPNRMSEEQADKIRPNLIFVMKVKLPNSNEFHSGPSGDTEYEEAHRKALFANKPDGFEIRYKRSGVEWPVDSSGFTWVPLYVSVERDGIAMALERADRAERSLREIREKITQI